MFLTVLNIFFLLAFLVFAYLNLNDKDAWLWAPIYGVAGICCGLAAFKIRYPSLYLALIGLYLLYGVVLFFSKDRVLDWIMKYRTPSLVETMQATKPYIEKAREFFGLLIISAALAMNYFVSVS